MHHTGNAYLGFELRRIDALGPIRQVPGEKVSAEIVDQFALYLEGEDLPIVNTSDLQPTILRVNMLPRGRYWSGGRQVRFEMTGLGQWVELGIHVPREAIYEVLGCLTKSNDGGIVDLLLDEQPLQAGVDLYAPKFLLAGRRTWGQLHLDAGAHKLRIRVVGTNPRSEGVRFASGLDYLELIPVSESRDPRGAADIVD